MRRARPGTRRCPFQIRLTPTEIFVIKLLYTIPGCTSWYIGFGLTKCHYRRGGRGQAFRYGAIYLRRLIRRRFVKVQYTPLGAIYFLTTDGYQARYIIGDGLLA
jgi:hypothetical protein